MIVEPYREGSDYGEYLEGSITFLKKYVEENDDDFMIIMVGDRSTGKSMLSLHMLELFMGKDNSHNLQVCGSREKFATSYYKISHAPKPRALVFDEANVNRRRSMESFNNDLLDQYYSNRGLNMFHIWCNPSLQMIDQIFIDELIKGVIFLPTENKKLKTFRYYYYFHKESIQAMYEKFGKLSIKILSKNKDKYAWYRGWFKDYNGSLRQEYRADKDVRMKLKAKQFYEKYGETENITRAEAAKTLGVHIDTIANHMEGLEENTDYNVNASGRYSFTKDGFEKLKLSFKRLKKDE